jgi:hypothetical protein
MPKLGSKLLVGIPIRYSWKECWNRKGSFISCNYVHTYGFDDDMDEDDEEYVGLGEVLENITPEDLPSHIPQSSAGGNSSLGGAPSSRNGGTAHSTLSSQCADVVPILHTATEETDALINMSENVDGGTHVGDGCLSEADFNRILMIARTRTKTMLCHL